MSAQPMSPETLTALQQSIAKWERNAEASKPDDAKVGIFSCPLCLEFYDNDCVECPVSIKSGARHCLKTPYQNAEDLHEDWMEMEYSDPLRESFRAAARAEVEFLRSLLPEAQS